MLLRLYTFYAYPPTSTLGAKPTDPEAHPRVNGHANGSAMLPNGNGHARTPFNDRQRLRDAEEFELEGLMSDDDDVGVGKERVGAR